MRVDDRGILLSFNYEDVALAEALRASLFMLDHDLQVFLSPVSYGAVSFKSVIANGIAKSDGFLLLIGPNGIGTWQEVEFSIALDRNVQDSSFPVVPVIAGGGPVPGFSFLRNLNWIEAPVVTDYRMLRRLIAALKGELTAVGTSALSISG